MNVLIVTQYFWPENFRINDLVVGLVERGHDVTVYTGIPNYPGGKVFKGYGFFNKAENYQGAKIIRVPLIPRGSGGAVRLGLNYLSFAAVASVMAPLLCRGKSDIIFVFSPSPITVGLPAIVLKWLKSCPILFWVQDLWPESLSATGNVTSKTALSLVERLVRLIYSHCDQILVSSRAYIPRVRMYCSAEKRIDYFPQFVEDIYRPLLLLPHSQQQALMPKGFKIMFAGNIGAAQDFGTILDAAERLREHSSIHWVIIGDGRKRSWVEEEIIKRRLQASVHLLGQHPLDLMPLFFAVADVMLVTLKNDLLFSLTVPGKTQSYLACGKPIIAVLEGEGARIVEEAGAGKACQPGNAEALARAVLNMYRLPEETRRRMGQSGLEYHQKHFERTMLLDRLNNWFYERKDNGRKHP